MEYWQSYFDSFVLTPKMFEPIISSAFANSWVMLKFFFGIACVVIGVKIILKIFRTVTNSKK